MSNVQKENGFTPIANELLEVVPRYNFNGTQMKIILTVWRYTYGFKRKEHDLSINFIVNATGTSKRQIQKEVNRLIENKVLIEVQKPSFNQTRKIGFNKKYHQWTIEHSRTKEQQMNDSSEMNNSTPHQVNNSSPQQMNDSTPHQVNNSSPKKESIKEIYKETTKERESSVVDPVSFYSDNFGMISPYMAENIEYWIEDTSSELVVEAMRIALKNGVRKFNYVEGILKDWKSKNYKTPKDLIEESGQEKPKTKEEILRDELEEIKETLNLGEDYFQAVGNPGRYSELVKRRDELNEQLRAN